MQNNTHNDISTSLADEEKCTNHLACWNKRMFDVSFIHAPGSNMVICKISECAELLNCDMCKRGWRTHPYLQIRDKYVGKAICQHEDVFDKAIGERIAYNKAMMKLINAKKRRLKSFIKHQRKNLEKIETNMADMDRLYDKKLNFHTAKIKKASDSVLTYNK